MQNKQHLKVENLKKSYSGRTVVNGLSFHVNRGEVVGLIGPNGAGKTTAFYMTIGLIKPDEGTVFFQEQNVTALPIHKRAQMGMGYLAQEPSVFRHLTVEQNVNCILECLDIPQTEKKQRLQALLEELHLTHLSNKIAMTLSGGERRRLEITRALATQPTFLLLDEPFANIDPISVQEVKQMVQHLSKKNISILITDHNAREIFSICNRAYLIQDGTVTLSGAPDELIASAHVRSSYLGDDFRM